MQSRNLDCHILSDNSQIQAYHGKFYFWLHFLSVNCRESRSNIFSIFNRLFSHLYSASVFASLRPWWFGVPRCCFLFSRFNSSLRPRHPPDVVIFLHQGAFCPLFSFPGLLQNRARIFAIPNNTEQNERCLFTQPGRSPSADTDFISLLLCKTGAKSPPPVHAWRVLWDSTFRYPCPE